MQQARRTKHVNRRSHTAAGQPSAAQSATLGGFPRESGVSHHLGGDLRGDRSGPGEPAAACRGPGRYYRIRRGDLGALRAAADGQNPLSGRITPAECGHSAGQSLPWSERRDGEAPGDQGIDGGDPEHPGGVGEMSRILLLLDHKTNRALLSDWLKQHYEVVIPDNGTPLVVPFDLCLIDGPTLDRLWQEVRLRKAEDAPTFLPVVLITSQREAELLTRHLWKTVDELIRVPIEKLELQARVEILLRTRQLSRELKLRNERLGVQGRHDLERIQSIAVQMQEIIDGLVDFARVERADRQLQHIALDQLVQRCVQDLEQEVGQRQALVVVDRELPMVQGNVVLLMLALTNLLSNALKFVPPGVRPTVTIRAATTQQVCRLEIEDNGIGIAPEDQLRLFRPFVRLHGVEVYDGVGLGLATVRKAVELMRGRIGITSSIGHGSVFWMELRAAE